MNVDISNILQVLDSRYRLTQELANSLGELYNGDAEYLMESSTYSNVAMLQIDVGGVVSDVINMIPETNNSLLFSKSIVEIATMLIIDGYVEILERECNYDYDSFYMYYDDVSEFIENAVSRINTEYPVMDNASKVFTVKVMLELAIEINKIYNFSTPDNQFASIFIGWVHKDLNLICLMDL